MIPGGLEVLLFAKRADGSHELTGGNRVYRDKSLPPDLRLHWFGVPNLDVVEVAVFTGDAQFYLRLGRVTDAR